MELKNIILSTIEELEPEDSMPQTTNINNAFEVKEKIELKKVEPISEIDEVKQLFIQPQNSQPSEDETLFLESMRERLLVLFDGFQSPNNTKIEAKVDLTLNFLEYLLATVDTRLEKIKPKGK
ncbi:MAG: hypothetical protein GQ570_02355 [Helicobacteraceae bacterium]|nr:hypothetical protein [Helicobacteraceae bacterium]